MVGGSRRVRGGFGSVAAGRGSFERDGVRACVRACCVRRGRGRRRRVPACVTADARRSGPGPSVTEAAVQASNVYGPMGLTAARVLSVLWARPERSQVREGFRSSPTWFAI